MLDYPFGILTKNMKFVPKFQAQTNYVPNVPNIRHILGTKSSSAQFTLKSSFREGSSFLFSVFSRWGKGQVAKKGKN